MPKETLLVILGTLLVILGTRARSSISVPVMNALFEPVVQGTTRATPYGAVLLGIKLKASYKPRMHLWPLNFLVPG